MAGVLSLLTCRLNHPLGLDSELCKNAEAKLSGSPHAFISFSALDRAHATTRCFRLLP